ncbi:hypothetical protein HHK36_002551 [Tetracentron sinense]|uniref:Alpha/beta hydrolase fold-3 domain-containing protein n=1 Tax=Tetracentron sinense TaxID=13715 RepID=A0A834ZVR7_TETSI|nr:hypothetical protein HHK36_002551 [Tetracentron sinense]
MDSSKAEITLDFPPFLRVYKDGRVERLLGTDIVPPSINPETGTGVSSKDVIIVPETGVSARIYLPKITDPLQKLPLLVYFHGGGFCIETSSSPTYHNYLNSLVAEANVVAVSVDYRRAPEHPVPTAYEDSWAALQWVASHSNEDGPEAWLRNHANFDRVFLAGDSAGANIAHNMALRATEVGLCGGVKLLGIVLVHPYFWGDDRIDSEAKEPKGLAEKLWLYVCPSAADINDPRINPVAVGAPKLSGLGCRRVLVCVAEKDGLRDRGWLYHDAVAQSGWDGVVEIMEAQGENHVFHLFNPTCENAVNLMKRFASFINHA